jgi:hypothetical protein
MRLFDGPRRARLEQALAALFDDESALIAAIVADGWPLPMARKGLELHRKTWNVDDLVDAFEQELAPFRDLYVGLPQRVCHVWPALPGAGVTPLLYGLLLGVEQRIRPSRRGAHFARYFTQKSGLDLVTDETWLNDDVVVISGSDETIVEVRRMVSPATRVIAYGHRVSFGLVLDADGADLDDWALRLALDTVLWHQAGCFSLRGVVFVGSHDRANLFAESLGQAIAETEKTLGADTLDADLLARRAQAIGLARLQGPIFGPGIGWVQPTTSPFTGQQPSPQVVTLHRMDRLDELAHTVGLPPRHLQGAAIAAVDGDPRQENAIEALAALGVTRICAAGTLQSPPANWPHDGQPHMLGWLNLTAR